MASEPISKRFSDVASGVQSIVVALGVVIGGWWTLKTFVFQNPAFYEQGFELVGNEAEFVRVSISAEPLGGRKYALAVAVANSSRSLKQIITLRYADIFYSRVGSNSIAHASVLTRLPGEPSIDVPPSDSRELHYYVEFPEDGVYLVEVDLCRHLSSNCLAQKYVAVASEPADQPPPKPMRARPKARS